MSSGQLKFGFDNLNRWFLNLKGGVLLASVVIIVCFISTIVIFNKSIAETKAVDQTTDVQNALEQTASGLKDVQNGMHGYLLTGDSTFLTPYFNIHDVVWYNFNSAYVLTQGNKIQQERLDSLKYYITRRIAVLDNLYANKQMQPDAPQDQQLLQTGKRNMLKALSIIDEMKHTEDVYYQERYTAAKSHLQNARILITLFLSISVIVAITSFYALTKSQREISEREIRYRNLFDQNKEIIFTLNEAMDIIEINQAVFEHLGYTQKEIQESGILSKFSTSSKSEILDLIKTVHRVDNYEVELITAQNETKLFLLDLLLTDKVKGNYQGSLYDINYRIKLEEERVSLERFANVGKVARVIAHEVRNPLTNIQLSVNAMEKIIINTEADEYLKIIDKNAYRINNLISELLSSTKLTDFNITTIKINQLIEETLIAAMDRIQLNKITLVKIYDPDLCEVKADPEKLKIALLNLIMNGIEAMEAGGTLKVETKKSKNNCIVIIEDTGKGIDKDDLKKIFQPFFTTKSNGTGLGLATAQNIILNHAGSVHVESFSLKGTKFTVVLKLD